MNLTQPQAERTALEQRIYWGAKGVALAAAIVALTVVALLSISWLTAGHTRPSDSPALAKLVKQVGGDARNPELREQVRDLDVLARQAYLTSLTFRKRGALLLLVALAVLLGSLKLMSGIGRMVPAPATRDDDNRDVRVMASAAVLCFLAFLSGLVCVYAQQGRALPPSPAVPIGKSAVTPSPTSPPKALPSPQAAPTVADEQQAATNWPAFRGWRGLGASATDNTPTGNTPTGWNGQTGSNVVWKTSIPLPGFNSPVVWERQVFVCGADSTQRVVYAFDAGTGTPLWHVAVRVSADSDRAPDISDHTGHAASTMACDSRHAYAIFANGDLICVDHAGRVVWSKNLGVPGISYGYASSLLAYEGRLFVQRDVGEDSALLALDSATGTEIWRAARGEGSAWCSPIMATRNGAPVLVVNGAGSVAAYAPATGAQVWAAEGLSGEVAPSPASADGLVVVALSGSGCLAINLDDGAKVWANAEVDAPEITSPVMADEMIFVLYDMGILTCLQAATGTVLWKHEFDATFASSPIIRAGRLYLTDTTGRTHVLQVAGTYQPVAGVARLGEPCHATPAAAGNRLFLRGRDHLFCIGDAPK